MDLAFGAAMKRLLLFCALVWVGQAYGLTITINPNCTQSTFDCYIDLSNGTYATNDNGTRYWLQNDGIYSTGIEHLGWRVQASVSAGYGYGNLAIFAPEQFERGYTWLGDFAWNNQTPDWGYYMGSKALQWGLWEGTVPVVEEVPGGQGLLFRASWNVPDNSSTLVLLGIGLLGFVALRRKCSGRC